MKSIRRKKADPTTQRRKQVLRMRSRANPLSFHEIGAKLGISHGRARIIHLDAIRAAEQGWPAPKSAAPATSPAAKRRTAAGNRPSALNSKESDARRNAIVQMRQQRPPISFPSIGRIFGITRTRARRIYHETFRPAPPATWDGLELRVARALDAANIKTRAALAQALRDGIHINRVGESTRAKLLVWLKSKKGGKG